MPVFPDLRDRRSVVTGGARGIGRAITDRLVENGASVVVVDKDREALAEAASAGKIALRGDLGTDDLSVLAERLVEEHGVPDLIVNNVGIETDHGFFELEQSDFDLVLATNLRGPWFFTKRLVEELVCSGRGGAIVFISSLHDTFVYGRPHYSASKAAVAMLTKELARDLGKHGIRVNAISPGGISTDPTKLGDLPRPGIPLGRLGVPDDIASVAVALLSDECSGYMTGANVPVDGGAALCDIWAGS